MSQVYPQGYPIQPVYPQAYSVPTQYSQAYYPQYGYVQPQVVAPSTGYYDPYSFRNCLSRFFGFAPTNGVRYRTDRDTWGFMGYSRRQRYIDARTGQEVDRKGRPVYRI